ncbi:MAG: hypothetical protein EBZ05_06715 [Verrucomicrobia bacterium]|nr:hypothetical protein [Verrucomicrobiota bacterium]
MQDSSKGERKPLEPLPVVQEGHLLVVRLALLLEALAEWLLPVKLPKLVCGNFFRLFPKRESMHRVMQRLESMRQRWQRLVLVREVLPRQEKRWLASLAQRRPLRRSQRLRLFLAWSEAGSELQPEPCLAQK